MTFDIQSSLFDIRNSMNISKSNNLKSLPVGEAGSKFKSAFSVLYRFDCKVYISYFSSSTDNRKIVLELHLFLGQFSVTYLLFRLNINICFHQISLIPLLRKTGQFYLFDQFLKSQKGGLNWFKLSPIQSLWKKPLLFVY